jgi:hypothetical protein
MEVSVSKDDYYDVRGVKHLSPSEAAIWNGIYRQDWAAEESRRAETIRGYYKPRAEFPKAIPVGAGAASAPGKKSSPGKAIFWAIVLWIVFCLLPGAGTQKTPSHPARPAAAVMQSR